MLRGPRRWRRLRWRAPWVPPPRYELWLGWATLEGAVPGGVPYTGFSEAVQEDRGHAAVHLGSWESGKAHLNEEITQCPELCKASVR